jgi:aminoglycoside phosphotransferase (APT) family kinase protein
MHSLPTTPDEIDAIWLTEALAVRHPGVRVAEVEVVARREVTNTHAELRVRYDAPAGAPSQMFCKMLPFSDSARRQAIAGTGMGLREALFYECLAPTLALRVPTVHVACHDASDGSFLLLLEDLASTGCTVSDGPTSVAPAAAAQALEDLAELHVRYEDPARRTAEAAWVPPPMAGGDYGDVRLRYGLDHHRDRLSPHFAAIAELYLEKRQSFHALWDTGPRTVIHGDLHIGNLFDDHGRTGFLDWGVINVSTPLRDVSYFLNLALSIDDRRRHERELLRHYLDARAARGGLDIGFEEAWRTHRLQAAYTVPACCQIVTFPEDATERRRIFAAAFLARAEAALEDLEVRAALRRFADL